MLFVQNGLKLLLVFLCFFDFLRFLFIGGVRTATALLALKLVSDFINFCSLFVKLRLDFKLYEVGLAKAVLPNLVPGYPLAPLFIESLAIHLLLILLHYAELWILVLLFFELAVALLFGLWL